MNSSSSGHTSSMAALWCRCGSAFYRTVTLRLWNSVAISLGYHDLWSMKASRNTYFSGNYAPGGLRRTLNPNTKPNAKGKYWLFCSDTTMKAMSTPTRSLQMRRRGLLTSFQKPSHSRCNGVTVNLRVGPNSSRLYPHGMWCTRSSETRGAFCSLTSCRGILQWTLNITAKH